MLPPAAGGGRQRKTTSPRVQAERASAQPGSAIDRNRSQIPLAHVHARRSLLPVTQRTTVATPRNARPAGSDFHLQETGDAAPIRLSENFEKGAALHLGLHSALINELLADERAACRCGLAFACARRYRPLAIRSPAPELSFNVISEGL